MAVCQPDCNDTVSSSWQFVLARAADGRSSRLDTYEQAGYRQSSAFLGRRRYQRKTKELLGL